MQRSLQTLTIQQVSQRLKVTKHTLRFWEKT
ncbi:MAG: MerR family DNA-binding transcriptional regulator, partial [Candidatus Hodarchaeota archaeon]